MKYFFEVQDLSLELSPPNSKPLKVLDNISFGVKKGEIVSLLGPSGCGKTTLLRVIAGIIKTHERNVVFNGETIKEMRDRGAVSYVPQHSLILPFRTVEKNISLPLEFRGKHNQSRVNNLLSLFNLDRFADYYPKQLSGGMKKKVAVARAMATRPRLLLMDEPFSSLDDFAREKLDEDLILWKEKLKSTIIFVTHSIEEAVFLSDRVLVLSARPARIQAVMQIELPKARRNGLRTRRKFAEIAREVRKITRNL